MASLAYGRVCFVGVVWEPYSTAGPTRPRTLERWWSSTAPRTRGEANRDHCDRGNGASSDGGDTDCTSNGRTHHVVDEQITTSAAVQNVCVMRIPSPCKDDETVEDDIPHHGREQEPECNGDDDLPSVCHAPSTSPMASAICDVIQSVSASVMTYGGSAYTTLPRGRSSNPRSRKALVSFGPMASR